MSWSRIFTRFCAVVAVGALFYSQSMACCWNMGRSEVVSVISENSGMSPDHSCCKKSAEPMDGVLWSAPGMDCGYKAFESATLPHASLEFLPIPYSLEKYSGPGFSGFMIAGLGDEVFDTGPPVYLLTLRLLI